MPLFDDPRGTLASLKAQCPGDKTDVLRRASRVVEGRFDLLGYEGLSYGAPIDWQRDPVHERRAPELHWSRVPYLDAEAVGDHKVTWEVSRQQYLVTLGQAYWYTGDERWADTFAEHVTAWLDANHPKRGMNWASSLEVAFRAMSWIWAIHFFRGSRSLTPTLYARVLNALHIHARHLERYLSTYFSPNTHLTGEALGLVHIGALVPELGGAERWLRTGVDVLTKWLPRQVRADGGYFEQATQYHRYTTEFALHLSLLDARHGWGLERWLRPLLERLATYLQAVTRPDGTMSLIGDDDGGTLISLDGRAPDDLRGVMAQLAAYLESPTLRHTAGAMAESAEPPPSAIWLLGAEASRSVASPPVTAPAATSAAFRESGVFVMREAWRPDAAHAIIDCGPHGAFNAGHAHADLLSITASAGGRTLLTDSGTYTYSGPERNEFRAATAHNVLLVDGEGSSEPASNAFQWRSMTSGRLLDWTVRPEFVRFEGEHDGFARIPGVGAHRRSVLFLPGVGWFVRDRLEASGAHDVRLHWHAGPRLQVRVEADDRGAELLDEESRPLLRVAAFGAGCLTSEAAWISPRYGARFPATRVVYAQRQVGAHEVVTALLLGAHAASRFPELEECAIPGVARAFIVRPAAHPPVLIMLGAGVGWDVGLAAVFGRESVGAAVQAGDDRVLQLAPSERS